jgi:hypothetical protein
LQVSDVENIWITCRDSVLPHRKQNVASVTWTDFEKLYGEVMDICFQNVEDYIHTLCG